MRMRQPPENWTTGRSMEKRSSSGFPLVKPKPQRIFLTFASADSAPVASKSAATVSSSSRVFSSSSADTSREPSSMASSISSNCASNFSSRSSSSTVLRSAAKTSSTAERLLAFASCSTRITSQFRGTGRSRAAMWRRIVVLPMPLGPRMPYLLPCTMVIVALLKRVWPGAVSVKFSHVKASPAGGGSFFPLSSVRVNADREPGAASSWWTAYCGFFSRCFSWSRFSLFVSFSPFATFSRTSSILSSKVGSASFPLVLLLPAPLAALLSAASFLSLASFSSSVSSSASKTSALKSGWTNTRTVSKPGGGFGTATWRLSGFLYVFLLTSTTSVNPSNSGSAIASSGSTSQLPR
mmetsp:Transcript_24312/g.69316  ORF Transcript_24312/g.69316 Transcript_24312/m.69316 type:complete len:352 (-) Transcript_24312:658-1713(-)